MRAAALATLLVVALTGCGGEPRPVVPTDLRGAQAHPMWDGTDAEDRRELDLLRELGADVVRIDVSWPYVEPRRGRRDPTYLGRLDRYVEAAAARGLLVLPVLIDTPCWAARRPAGCRTPADDRSLSSPPRDPRDFARHAAFIATRYGDRLAAVELYNEPNLPSGRFWRSDEPAAEYARMLHVAVPEIARAAPGVPVLAGAVTLFDLEFVRDLVAAGLPPALDGFSVHPYTGVGPPEDALSRMVEVRDLVRRPVWITEAGAASCERGDGWACVGPQGQAEHVRRLSALAGGDVKAVIVYALRDKDAEGVEGHFGLVGRDFAAKPSLQAARELFARR